MGSTRKTYEVRPRLVWSGLAAAVLGMVVLAFGVAGASWVWSVLGVVVLLAGVALGVSGGGLHDTHQPGLLPQEVGAVVHGTTRRTVRHGQVSGAPAEASREADRTRRRLLATTARTRATPLAPLAAAVLLGTGILLMAAQEPLYPMTHAGQMGSLRVLGAGVVFTLAGLRVLMGAPGRHLPSLLLALFAAIGLFAGALLIGHHTPSAPFVEALGGVIGAAAAGVCLASPKRLGADES